MNRTAALLSAVALLCSALRASQDPPPPPGGFPQAALSDQLLTWSDGYSTLVDITYPMAAPPPRGWPMVALIHGGGRNRKDALIQRLAHRLAAAGHVTLAWDYRGEGDTDDPALGNPPWSFNELDLTYDAAEAFASVAALIPSVPCDLARLGMSGISGGGRHAYRGAAVSGRLLPANGRPPTVAPLLKAVAPIATHLDPIEDFVPRGNTIRSVNAVTIFNELPPSDPMYQAVITYDPAALAALFRAQELKDFLPLLRISDVPTLTVNAWDDQKHAVLPITSGLAMLKPGVMRRLVLTTDGVHSVPRNDVEQDFAVDAIQRWFDFHLKGFRNGVDAEPLADLAFTPLDVGRYANPASQWGHVVKTAWPPADPPLALYLDAGGGLVETPPSAAQPGPVVQHRIGIGYSLTDYLTDGGVPSVVIAPGKLSLSAVTFDTAPLQQDTELLGRATFSAQVDVTGTEYQLHAQLHAVPPASSGAAPRYLTFGTSSARNLTPGLHQTSVTYDDSAHVIPAGWRLRLTLQNLALRQTPIYTAFHELPYFTDTDLTVTIDPSQPARIELPIATRVDARLTPRMAGASSVAGIQHPLAIDAGADRAGDVYLTLIGASGYAPGFPLPGVSVPLNFDAISQLGVRSPNVMPFAGFAGIVDGAGRAQSVFWFTPATVPPQLTGVRLTFAVVGFGPAGFWSGGPAVLEVLP